MLLDLIALFVLTCVFLVLLCLCLNNWEIPYAGGIDVEGFYWWDVLIRIDDGNEFNWYDNFLSRCKGCGSPPLAPSWD